MVRKVVIRLLCCFVLLNASGCVLTALGIGVAGVSVTKTQYDNLVTKSYTYPYWAVYKAAYTSLEELDIERTEITHQAAGDTIHGQTADYEVRVELHQVTDKVTRVTCKAGNTIFTQDRATAAAITDHINTILLRVFAEEGQPTED